MAHIIITGATGTAGSAVLQYCLASTAISKVSVLSRRPVKLAEGNEKANVIIHTDYTAYSEDLLSQLQGAIGCIWAQGISALGVSKSDYTRITYDFPLAAARALSTLGPHMNFVYVSGEGADPTGKSRLLFARIKGRAESDLLGLAAETPSLSVYNARPGSIDPGKAFIADRAKTLNDRLTQLLVPAMKFLTPSMHSPTDKLSEVLVALAIGNGEAVPEGKGVKANGWTLENTALRRLVGL